MTMISAPAHKQEESMDIKTEILTLREQLERYNKAYYEDDNPIVSDAAYDAALERLHQLET